MRRPYSILLPVGFAVPLLLPAARCALTAPFRPCRIEMRRFVFCGTVPWVAPAGRYPAPFLAGARTFLPHTVTRMPAVARPSGKHADSRKGGDNPESRQLVTLRSKIPT